MARTLLTNLVARGLDPPRPLLFGIDGSQALRKAIREVWGAAGVVQRCQVHKTRNVLDHLPDTARPRVRSQLRQAYDAANYSTAKAILERLARDLEPGHPGAAASLREGLDETLTLQRLGICGALFRTLRSTRRRPASAPCAASVNSRSSEPHSIGRLPRRGKSERRKLPNSTRHQEPSPPRLLAASGTFQ